MGSVTSAISSLQEQIAPKLKSAIIESTVVSGAVYGTLGCALGVIFMKEYGNNELNTVKQQIEQLKTNEEQRMTDLHRQCTEAKKKLQATQAKLQNVTKLFQSSRIQISQLNENWEQMNSKLSSVENKYNLAQSQIETLTKQCKSAKEQISTLNTKYQQEIAALKKQLDNLAADYKAAIQELKSLKDPKKIKENQSKLFLTFLNQLPPFNIYNKIPKRGNVKYVVILGETSAGKSTIYNKLFGLNLKIGQGEVTQKIEIIHLDVQSNRVYFDVPGLNEEIEIIDPKLLQAFYKIDYVFIMTGTTFKLCKRAIQVMDKINPPQLIMVRTKCDLFPSDAELQGEMKKDQNYLASLGVKRQVLYISAMKPDSFLDNSTFKKLMTGK